MNDKYRNQAWEYTQLWFCKKSNGKEFLEFKGLSWCYMCDTGLSNSSLVYKLLNYKKKKKIENNRAADWGFLYKHHSSATTALNCPLGAAEKPQESHRVTAVPWNWWSLLPLSFATSDLASLILIPDSRSSRNNCHGNKGQTQSSRLQLPLQPADTLQVTQASHGHAAANLPKVPSPGSRQNILH